MGQSDRPAHFCNFWRVGGVSWKTRHSGEYGYLLNWVTDGEVLEKYGCHDLIEVLFPDGSTDLYTPHMLFNLCGIENQLPRCVLCDQPIPPGWLAETPDGPAHLRIHDDTLKIVMPLESVAHQKERAVIPAAPRCRQRSSTEQKQLTLL